MEWKPDNKPIDQGKTIMPFGNNMGEYMEDLEDKYLRYLTRQAWVEDKFPKIYKRAKELLDED